MGVSLFPRTTDDRVLEKLAAVPQGTAVRLRAAKAVKVCTRKGVSYYLVPGTNHLHPVKNPVDMEEIYEGDYERTSSDSTLSRLESFLLNGWGRFTKEAAAQLVEWGHADEHGYVDCNGHIMSEDKVGKLLALMGFFVLSGDLVVRPPRVGMFARIPLSQIEGVVWG